ncbi:MULTISPECIES: 2-oxoglutarate dehydrogenase complex dihydrolipoyllysine-residue succinyltransferase [Thermus]|uniref:Dihydrolipoyllysine-residue succinyltransferase component of 2-oxoglutarate dehydrogenase complex n=1 Tax=Thermus brockianus TaxID=56956 RepID=A0A1J0LT82_THEBO|nr:2-oxoglutarate dehydrogenase complex dihydrolipoyllysine-residue succinyltransferase [Thermus brockianus]APD09432.1 2-oxoglutarate dehydrogenase E2 component (dihydrolipoamide succinyltransferase) [Thermus brockianus]BDG17291.1 dihydrolipoyllysine-residue succinyltransferase component of 2-oxoglutarate dehydrogenase complex [Thermus brockianus]
MEELKVPSVGESIVEVEIGAWLKREGESFAQDEPLVELITDKATLELPAPFAGTLRQILRKTGETARVGEAIALLERGVGAEAPKAEAPQAEAVRETPLAMPAAERLLREKGVSPEAVEGTGLGGRILKEDVERYLEVAQAKPAPEPARPVPETRPAPTPLQAPSDKPWRVSEAVPMTPLRRRIAERLLLARQTTAMLTTFNEADMSAVIALRKELGEAFQKKHGVKLGFMSFFVKAVVQALKEIPELNAEIRDNTIVYHRYYDIGIAVGGGEGLVVPVIRDADRLSFAEIERQIADFAERARTKKLKPEELMGGTFTITNGGIYGSLNSTPLLNPPQVGILGMHAIQERPVAREGQVVVRPMMYLALSYDHRIVDGREAVTFLRRVKELIENPVRLLLEV